MYHTVHSALTDHSVLGSRSVFRIGAFFVSACALLSDSASAQQAPASQSVAQVISCVSKPGERQVCAADTAAGVALLRSSRARVGSRGVQPGIVAHMPTPGPSRKREGR